MNKVSDILFDAFGYEIIMNGNKQDIESDTFFIDISTLTSNQFIPFSDELFNITIDYVKERDLTLIEKLNMKSRLNELFKIALEVEETSLVFQKKTWNTKDGFLSLCLTISFKNGLRVELPGNASSGLMHDLNVNGKEI